jgi:electron-transferring-flavoprotein dehydrogenase
MDQGVDREGQPQVNYQTGEVIQAQTIILAEGCDGLLAEKFIQQAGLKRETHQLYSLGLKMLFRVDPERYRQFGEQRAVHTIGWPLWRPIVGPSLFGGGFIYPAGENQLAVGIITGLDYPFCDFNPQDALARFWQHAFVSPFLEGAVRVEAGARLIPEGGYYALPRAPDTGSIGRANVLLVGDSAGLVSMLKIKGLHNALLSGMAAGTAAAHEDVVSAHDSEAVTAHDGEAATARDGEAITAHDGATPALDGATPAHDGATPAHDGAHAAHVSGERETTATRYTHLLEESGVLDELRQSKDFRQVVARFGPLIGKPLSVFARFLPRFKIEPDYATLTTRHYPLGMEGRFDKADFVALAGTSHREEQRCHLLIQDSDICMRLCLPKYGAPCITFCPAGVYEGIQGTPKAANPSNCLHCKTCQRKCPFDNIRWTVPEGTGGTRYKNL